MLLDQSNPKHAHAIDRLGCEIIIWLSSVRKDGRPHLVPVWFLWQDDKVLIFSQPNNQKIRNIAQNGNVMLALEALNNGEDVVMFEGMATLVQDHSVTMNIPAYADKYNAQISSMGATLEKMAAEYSQPIVITPTKFHIY